jgi:hypothetical protein
MTPIRCKRPHRRWASDANDRYSASNLNFFNSASAAKRVYVFSLLTLNFPAGQRKSALIRHFYALSIHC